MATLQRRIVVRVEDAQFVRHHGNLRQYLGLSRQGLQGTQRAFREAGRAAERYGRDAKDGTDRASRAARENARDVGVLERGWNRLRTAIAGIAVGAALRFLFQLNAGMEQARIGFATLLGSAEAAGTFLRQLTDFAARTPFEMPGLINASRQLLAFGFGAESIVPMLTAVGDAVAAMGGGADMLDRVIRALGQMQAKGRVSAEEMMQLAEAGIPAWQMLADAIGVSIPEAMKLAEQRSITGAQGIDAILQGMTERFGGAMEAQSQTAAGLLSTLMDLFRETSREVTGLAFEELKGDIAAVTDEVQRLRSSGQLGEWARQAAEGIRTAYQIGRAFLANLVEWGPTLIRIGALWAATTAAVKAFTLAQQASTLAVGFARTLYTAYVVTVNLVRLAYFRLTAQAEMATAAQVALNAALRANPYGLVATAIAAVVAGVVLFTRRTDEATEALRRQQEQAEATWRALQLMSGVQLRTALTTARQNEAGAQAALDAAEARIRALLDRGREMGFSEADLVRLGQAAPQGASAPGIANAAALGRQLIALRREEAALLGQATRARNETELIERRLTTETGTRLEGLRSEIAELEALGEEQLRLNDAAETERDERGRALHGLERYRALLEEANRLEAEQARLRGDTTITPAGKPPTQAELNREKRAAEQAAEARREATREVELYRAASDDVRAALQGVHRAEDALRELEENRAELLRRFGAVGREVYDARKEQLEAERSEAERLRTEYELLAEAAARDPLGNAAVQFATRLREEAEAVRDAFTEPFASGGLMLPNFTQGVDGTPLLDMSDAEAALARYREEMGRLEFQVAEGIIRQEDYEEAAQQAAARARRAFEAVVRVMVTLGIWTEEDAKKMREMFAEVPRGASEAVTHLRKVIGELDELLGLLGSARDLFGRIGATSLASVVGEIEAVVGALRRAKAIQEEIASDQLTGDAAKLATLSAGIGVFAAVAGGIVSLGRAINAHAEGQRRLAEATRQAGLRFKEATEALLAVRPGGDLTPEQVEELRAAWDRMQARLGTGGSAPGDSTLNGSRNFAFETFFLPQLQAMQEAGLPTLQGIDIEAAWDAFRDAMPDATIQDFLDHLGLTDFFAGLGDMHGEYANTVDGAVAALERFRRFVSDDLNAALQLFIDKLLAGGAGRMSPEVEALLEEARALDLTTAAGRERLEEIIAVIASMPASAFPGMSPEDVDRLLGGLESLLDGGAKGAGQTSQSVQVARTITEVQANELLLLQHAQLTVQREMRDLLARMSAQAVAPGLRQAADVAGGAAGGGGAVGWGDGVTVNLTVHGVSQAEVMEEVAKGLRESGVFAR